MLSHIQDDRLRLLWVWLW